LSPASNLATTTEEGDLKISYVAGPTALRAHNDRSRIKMFWGPVRSGKSSAACWRGMQRARAASTVYNTSLRGLVIRDTYTNLRDSTLKTWLEWFPDKSACGYFHKSTQTYHLRTPDDREHEIMFRHGKDADDASNFLSTEFGWVLLEEVVPAYTKSGMVSPGISEDMFDAVIIRLAQRGIARPELDITCNPPTPQHWVNRRILARKPEELAADNIAHFFFPGKENEANLRPGYYDELRRLLKGQHTTIARFVDGEIVAIYPGVPVYQKDFSSKAHVSDKLRFDPARPVITFWDNPPTPACLIAQVDGRGRLLILKELQGGFIDGRIMEAVGQREFAKLVRAELQENFRGFKLGRGWADPALKSPSNTETKTPLQVLHAEGFTDIGFGIVDNDGRQEAVRGLLGTNLSGEAALQISRSGCPLLVEGMAGGYVFGSGTDGKRLTGAGPLKNEFSHTVNALEYGVSGLYPPVRPQMYKPQEARRPPSAMSA
jgi:hypothetical protein